MESLNLSARIFRPLLKVTDNIKEIELSDGREEYKLPIHLKYIGFGDIRLGIYAEIGGKIVSRGESILYDLLRLLWLSESPDDKIEDSTNILNLKKGRTDYNK